jgi:protein-tyrosine phosphatase
LKYGALLTLLGAAQLGLALRFPSITWLMGWSALSWIIAGAAYSFLGARAFGKQANGRLTPWIVVLLLPFFVVTWLLWHLQIALTKEPRHVEVVPGIWLGRRCYGHELPPGIRTVVDLTAEFPETRPVREGRTYLCLPTLDASIPSPGAFEALVSALAECEAPIYVHCALGHGRSAMVVVAALAATEKAASLERAEQIVKRARPGIDINAAQQTLLKQWWAACPRSHEREEEA